KVTVRTARAFRKENDGAALEQPIENVLQSAHAGLAINRNRIPIPQHRTENRETKQRLACKIIYRSRQSCADEWRIQEAGVVSREDHRPRARNAFAIINFPAQVKAEENMKEQPNSPQT